MSASRQVLPGVTYLLTRRCVLRQFLLTSSFQGINEAFLYCLAYAAEKYKFEIHGAVCLGNHYHLLATDVEGCLPRFMEWLNRNLATCINVERGRWGQLWSSEGYSGVALIEDDDVIDKMLYTLANPVEAALVSRGHEWPGFRSAPEDLCTREFVARRPKYFDDRGHLPETASLTFVKPRRFEHMSDDAYRDLVCQKYEAREGEIRKRLRAEGRKFLGVRRVRMQDPTGSPSSQEERREMNPRIACKRKWPRIAAIEQLTTFQKEYRIALDRYRDGDHDVVFPAGTWWMRVFFGVPCHPPP